MEIEKEKRKIEFWSDQIKIWLTVALASTKNKKPLEGPIEVSVKITNKTGSYEKRSMSDIVQEIEQSLKDYGFIHKTSDIRNISIKIISYSKTKCIYFFMQEVE